MIQAKAGSNLMSQSNTPRFETVEAELRTLEGFWQAKLPQAFRRLYQHVIQPLLAPCEFIPLYDITRGAGRSYGMLPQLLPFGRGIDDGSLYAFYALPDHDAVHWPVLRWDEDEMYVQPVSSSFDAFVRHCFTVGRYAADEMDDDQSQYKINCTKTLNALGINAHPEMDRSPRNDTELRTFMVHMDPSDAVSLCHLGCSCRAKGDVERALDYYFKASEATPYFGDPCYLAADVYRERGDMDKAVQSWWAVVHRLLLLCTRTYEWDLGDEHPEADIYEVAADGLAHHEGLISPDIADDPLWQAVAKDDPYDPEVRESLAHLMLIRGKFENAERELLNALSLCCDQAGSRPERLYDSLISLYDKQSQSRDAALARFDRQLPRDVQ